jgi:hypothetical protein
MAEGSTGVQLLWTPLLNVVLAMPWTQHLWEIGQAWVLLPATMEEEHADL